MKSLILAARSGTTMMAKLTVVIFVALILASCATDSTATRLQAGGSLKIVNLYPKFKAHMASCTEAHGFDPLAANIDERALAPGEIPWRECVYQGIDEYIIRYSTVPLLYKQIVTEDRAMTEQIALGELTRIARRSRLEEFIEFILTEEISARDILIMQANELDDFVNRQNELKEISRMHNQAMQSVRAIRGLNLR